MPLQSRCALDFVPYGAVRKEQQLYLTFFMCGELHS